MNVQIGKPLMDGLYIVYVPGIVRPWQSPQIAMWHRSEWHFRNSTERYKDPIHCWIGPLPVISSADAPPEYDL